MLNLLPTETTGCGVSWVSYKIFGWVWVPVGATPRICYNIKHQDTDSALPPAESSKAFLFLAHLKHEQLF
jgi:hypothetical protein